jgi:hypothetical protein
VAKNAAMVNATSTTVVDPVLDAAAQPNMVAAAAV